jgi:hypothetical protein
MEKYNIGADAKMSADVVRGGGLAQRVRMENVYHFECVGPDGVVKWTDEIHNLVTNVGLDDVLDKFLKGSTYTAAFYVGLTDGTPTVAAGDTMASHAGWVEVVAYTEGTREVLTLGTVAAQSVDNSASKASFAINADTTTVGGAFLNTVSTKSGSTGTLYGVGAFTGGDKAVDSGDTLNVTVTLTAASA